MISYVDAHCHLDLLKDIQKNPVSEDLQSIKTISVTNAPFMFSHNYRLFHQCKNIRVALGMHPELVATHSNQFNDLVRHIADTKYIGEVGLDGSKDFQNSYNLQKEVFEQILILCKEVNNKVLSVHSRNAATEIISLLNKHLKGSNCRVILHWFSGSLTELQKAVEFGCYFSINHKMTFSEKGRKIITSIPSHLLLTETDAPFTFDRVITGRLHSLQETIKNTAIIKGRSEGDMKKEVFENFRVLLKSIQ